MLVFMLRRECEDWFVGSDAFHGRSKPYFIDQAFMRLWRNQGSWMRDSGGEWGKDLNAFFFEGGDYVPYGLIWAYDNGPVIV